MNHPKIEDAPYYQITGTESFILIAWKLQILGSKNLWGVYLTPPPPPGRSRVKKHASFTYGFHP